ncbi:MAG: sensor histidine kinase [Carboxydocellales bacterium]|jgi:two-component system sensor histidine kinase DegS
MDIDNNLNKVVKDTLKAIEKSKTQIFDIAETARRECQRVQRELAELQKQTRIVIIEVDELERLSKVARNRLVEVDRDFYKFSEEDIKAAYLRANDYLVRLTQMRERESQMRQKRDELERSLKSMEETVEKAEGLVSHVGVVLDFLGRNLQSVNTRLEDLEQRQQVGIQVIKAQEEERKRIAREIHDGPAQAMANVVLRVEFCDKLLDFDPGKVREELASLKDMVRNTLKDVRKTIFDLRPMALDDLGLVPALKRYITDYKEKYLLNVNFVFYGKEQRLNPTVEVGLFRVIQEALNNVWKHAQATEVSVKLEIINERATAIVKDNGRGFNLEQALANAGRESLGLTSMRERVELLNGTLKIKTVNQKGTEILLTVPLKQE